MRKLFALLLALAMCVSLFGCGASKPAETTAPAETEAPVVETTAAAEPAEDVVILYTNDVHTYIDGPISYDVIAGLKASLEETYGNVLLVDAGDAVQGTAFGSMDKGETIVKLMNAAGYDLATLGNHEFDYGMDGAMNVIEWAEYPYVSCNFYHEENGVKGEPVLAPYEIVEIGGRKIAFIGITTPETFTKSTPAYFQDENGNYIPGTEFPEIRFPAGSNGWENTKPGETAKWTITFKPEGEEENQSMTYDVTFYDGSEEVASGNVTDTITWKLDILGVLTVSGTGEMPDWDNETTFVPWNDYKDKILEVVIESGVTSIGQNAFSGGEYSNLSKVTLPEGLLKISHDAFAWGNPLTEITIPAFSNSSRNALLNS